MTRRSIGVMLIGLVLLAAIVVPKAGTQAVPGQARAAPIPGPPKVGDCVIDSVKSPWQGSGAGAHQTYANPSQRTEPCAGLRYGEVTSMIFDPTTPTVSRNFDGSISSITDLNMEKCYRSNAEYLGLPMDGAAPNVFFQYWFPNLMAGATAAAPTGRQLAVGQHWLACVVYLLVDSTPPSDISLRYGRSLRNAVVTGIGRDQLGICLLAGDWSAGSQLGGCRSPHTTEVFAYGNTGPRSVARTALVASCTQLVRRFLRRKDETAAGRLHVQISVTDDTGLELEGGILPANSSAGCGVAVNGSRRLNGSLLAIGEGPIPWA